MKKSIFYLPLLFILASFFFSACGNPNGTANSARSNTANSENSAAISETVNGNNGSGANSNQSKTTKVFPGMPANVMKSELKGLDGKTFTLKQYEGKVILVNLWATWCGPCRMEMPELIKMENEYKDQGLVVVGLDLDPEPEESVKAFVEKQGLNYKIGWLSPESKRGFLDISQADVIPQSFLISRDGRLAGVFKGYHPVKTPPEVRRLIEDILVRPSE